MKQLLKYIIYEQALNVMFDALTKNLATATTTTYKIGNQFTSLSRIYTVDEYNSETGMYQQDNVRTIEVVYRHVKITTVDPKCICFEFVYSHSTRYGDNDNGVINSNSSGRGKICILLSDLESYWEFQ